MKCLHDILYSKTSLLLDHFLYLWHYVIHTYMHPCTHTSTEKHTHTDTHIQTQTDTHTNTWTHTNVNTWTQRDRHTDRQTHTYTNNRQTDRRTDTLIIIDNHWTISLIVPGFSSKWTIHRNLSIVGSQSVSMSVIVGEETTLGPKYYSLTQHQYMVYTV